MEFLKSYKILTGTLLRTLIYTVGHFVIAACVLVFYAGLDVYTALTSAVLEPFLNAVWYFVLDLWWSRNNK